MDGSWVPTESRKCSWGVRLITLSIVERSGRYSDDVVVSMSFGFVIGFGDGGGDDVTDFALRSGDRIWQAVAESMLVIRLFQGLYLFEA